MTYLQMTLLCWTVFWLYWMLNWRGNKKTVYRQSRVDRVLTGLGIWTGVLLFYWGIFSVGVLGVRLYPAYEWIQMLGVAVCAGGVGFAIWARRTIGRNWSGIITLKEDHELIRSGPYALTRHPIYTGILTAALGTAMVVGEVRALIALVLITVSFTRKLLQEERLMEQQFPQQYPAYRREVARLVPFVY